jgi:hypothetical protein
VRLNASAPPMANIRRFVISVTRKFPPSVQCTLEGKREKMESWAGGQRRERNKRYRLAESHSSTRDATCYRSSIGFVATPEHIAEEYSYAIRADSAVKTFVISW